MKNILVLLSLTLVVFLAGAGAGQAFYCGNDLILPGDRKIEVLHSCGEPDSIDAWEAVRNRGFFRFGRFWPSVEKVQVEEWTYNFGPSRFIRILRFENGELVDIKEGNYGFTK